MRTERPHRVAIVLAIAVALVAACGGGQAPSPSPSPSPSPTPTPDPHLEEPASVSIVFAKLDGAGLNLKANNADASTAGEPRKRINATYEGWPLIMSEYSSGAALRKAGRFDPTKKPKPDDPPYAFAGLNILVEYGPRTPKGNDPSPDPRFHNAAAALAVVLDRLLGPLEQRSIDPLPLVAATAPASPVASSPPVAASAGPSPSS